MRKPKTILMAMFTAALCFVALLYGSHTVSAQDYTLSDTKEILEAALHIREAAGHYDLDGDGAVTIKDAQLCLKHVLKIPVPPHGTSTPAPDATLPPTETPDTTPTSPAGSKEPEATQKPGEATAVPQPPATLNPSDSPAVTEPPATQTPGTSGTPWLSTDAITLRNIDDPYNTILALEVTCASITIYNISAYDEDIPDLQDYFFIEILNENEDGSPENRAGYYYSENKSQVYQTDLYNCFDIVSEEYGENYATFVVGVKKGYSGSGKFIIRYGTSYNTAEEYSCSLTAYSYVTALEKRTIIDEDYIEYGYMTDSHKKWYDKEIELQLIDTNGIGYQPASGDSLHITKEGNFKVCYYLPNRYSYLTEYVAVKETYLTTEGEYDPELTAAVREQIYREPDRDYPQDQLDYLTSVAEEWYQGKISYRTLRNTFRNTYREGWVSIGALDYIDEDGIKHYTFKHYDWQDWNDYGYRQDSLIFDIPGQIDVPTINDTLHKMSDALGFTVRGVNFIRVHYDKDTDTSYIYFIQ